MRIKVDAAKDARLGALNVCRKGEGEGRSEIVHARGCADCLLSPSDKKSTTGGTLCASKICFAVFVRSVTLLLV